MNENRLAVEVVTAIPGEARLAMRGDVDIAADEALAAAYAEATAAGASASSSTSPTSTTSTRPGSR